MSGHRARAAESLFVLSAGAAQSAAAALAARHGIDLRGEFGAVGAMRARLLDHTACDVVILTRAMIDELERQSLVVASAELGSVATCVAVRAADPAPDVSTPEALRHALSAADAIYFPDPEKATAGAHFARVLKNLEIRLNWKTFPNGATAMREMARANGKPIGCTQATEILATPGIRLVGDLPEPHALHTVYAAGVCAGAVHGGAAHRFLALLAGDASRDLRIQCGFQP